MERIQGWSVETIKVEPGKRVRQRSVEQVGNVPVPRFREQIAEVVTVILQELTSLCVSFGIIANENVVGGHGKCGQASNPKA